jgi:hypothetical protein
MANKKVSDLSARQAQQKLARLSREQFITPHVKEEEFELEGFGTVLLRNLTVKQRRKVNELAKVAQDGYDPVRHTLIGIKFCMIDPQLTLEDLEELEEQDATIIDRLDAKIGQMNNVGAAPDMQAFLEMMRNSSTNST